MVLALISGLALLASVGRQETSLLQRSQLASQLAQRVVADEQRLSRDVGLQQQFLQGSLSSAHSSVARSMLARYDDGCSCSCPESGCDEEKHEGPICTCPDEGASSLPAPFAPFNMDKTAEARKEVPRTQKMFNLGWPAHGPIRRQQMWVGSPQKMLPPDGDSPGGSTGIPEDGYIAYETGYADDGPFHGELAPMQVCNLFV